MQIAVVVIGCAILLVAAYCVVFNWIAVFVNARRRARGEQSHISMIFLVPQLFLATAYLLVHQSDFFQHTGWVFLLAGTLDASVLAIAWHGLRHGAEFAHRLIR